jgi:hypothetical protein
MVTYGRDFAIAELRVGWGQKSTRRSQFIHCAGVPEDDITGDKTGRVSSPIAKQPNLLTHKIILPPALVPAGLETLPEPFFLFYESQVLACGGKAKEAFPLKVLRDPENFDRRPIMTASRPDSRACRCLHRPGGGCRTQSSSGSRLAAWRSGTDSSAPSSSAVGRQSEP